MINVHARSKIGGTLIFKAQMLPSLSLRWPKMASRAPKRPQEREYKRRISNSKSKKGLRNRVFTRVFTVFFSIGHFQMILMTTLLFMTDDKPFVSKMNAHFYGSKL